MERSHGHGRRSPPGGGQALSASLRALALRYGEVADRRLGEALVSVVLFGSVARGEANRDSDVDLLLIVEGLPHGRFARMARLEGVAGELEEEREGLWRRGIHTDFSVLALTPEEARKTRPIYLDVVEDAVLLRDRDNFFAGILERLRERMKALGSRRLRKGRTRYWVLTPAIRPGEGIELWAGRRSREAISCKLAGMEGTLASARPSGAGGGRALGGRPRRSCRCRGRLEGWRLEA